MGLSAGVIARSWLSIGSMSPDRGIGLSLVSSSFPTSRALASDTLRSKAFWWWVFPAFIPADFAVSLLNLVICLHLWYGFGVSPSPRYPLGCNRIKGVMRNDHNRFR